MGKKDAYHDLTANSVIDPITCSNDATGNVAVGLDLLDYRGALIGVQAGVEGDLFNTSNYFTIKWQDSNDDSTYAACNDNDLIGGNNTQVIDSNGETPAIHVRAYRGLARYFRAIIDVTGTMANGTQISGFGIRYQKLRQ